MTKDELSISLDKKKFSLYLSDILRQSVALDSTWGYQIKDNKLFRFYFVKTFENYKHCVVLIQKIPIIVIIIIKNTLKFVFVKFQNGKKFCEGKSSGMIPDNKEEILSPS